MSQPEYGEFVPVRPAQPVTGAQPWLAQPPAWFTPMPPVRVDAGPPPSPVRAAGWLWLAASVLYLAGWIAAAFLDHPFIASDFANDPGFDSTESEASATAAAMLVFAVLGAAVISTGYTILGFLLWRRQNWARVTLAVFGGIMLVVLLLDVLIGVAWRSDVGGDDVWRGYPLLAALAAVQFGLTIAAIVTMFVPSANRFFAGARTGG